MGDNRLGFVLTHALQQSGAHRHQRGIATCTRGEGVNIGCVINRDLWHRNARLLRLAAHGVHQPALSFVTRLLNDFPPH
ncbi:hypothetical protein SRABI106_02593 [Rahnella aquatilis]|nr:hypothetical protein SRABI106_02593 [Rahnella aquatilis]